MEIILLERIKRLGNIGDFVNVKDGYARNYLLVRNKALRVTAENRAKFEVQKELIEKNNAEKKAVALKHLDKIKDKTFVIIRQAGDDGRLYGSVTNKDIASILVTNYSIDTPVENIILHGKIKEMGFHHITVELHADVEAKIRVVIARSEEEAKNELKKEVEKEELNKKKESDGKKANTAAKGKKDKDSQDNEEVEVELEEELEIGLEEINE
jgi:large subunit ribosomal protein L9